MILRFVSFLCLAFPSLHAGEIQTHQNPGTGWDIYTLRQEGMVVQVAPFAGANAFSVQKNGVAYFRVPEPLSKLPGVGYGNPVLYPMPNRVKGAEFTFEGTTYQFPKNRRGNFIHGLVHSEPFEVTGKQVGQDYVSLTCQLRFEPGKRCYELFPFPHDFNITIRVTESSVRWTYEVDNSRGEKNLPFGVGFHPYILYHGERSKAHLQVPATHLMESEKELPSGRLLPLDGHPLDARQPVSLEGYHADHVFYGMTPGKPAKLEFLETGRAITFHASEDFTHMVVWTPQRPFLGIENQTCSTDAHNLHSHGENQSAHLQVCPPGKKLSGTVVYVFE